VPYIYWVCVVSFLISIGLYPDFSPQTRIIIGFLEIAWVMGLGYQLITKWLYDPIKWLSGHFHNME